jgi:hypothetical protein
MVFVLFGLLLVFVGLIWLLVQLFLAIGPE